MRSIAHRFFYVRTFFLEAKLRRMHTDYYRASLANPDLAALFRCRALGNRFVQLLCRSTEQIPQNRHFR
jgi:hypothetical protein